VADDTEDPKNRLTSAGWYGVSFGLLGIAVSIALTGFNQMKEAVGGMQRRVMPGDADIVLAPGKATFYYETRSTFEGADFDDDTPLQFQCKLHDQLGHEVRLDKPVGRVTYDIAAYKGHNVFDVMVPAPGTYRLSCTAPRKFVLALGGGIGAWLVVAIVGGLLPGLGAIFVAVFVTLKRRRWRARQRAGATLTSP